MRKSIVFLSVFLIFISSIGLVQIYAGQRWKPRHDLEFCIGDGIIGCPYECKTSDDQNTVSWSFVAIADIHKTAGKLGKVLRWVRDNRNAYNIKFVILPGDIGDKGHGGISKEWVVEKWNEGYNSTEIHSAALYFSTYPVAPFSIRDTLEMYLKPCNIPWIPVMGNHDVIWEKYDSDEKSPMDLDYNYSCEDSFYKYFKDYPKSNTMYQATCDGKTYSFTNGYLKISDWRTHDWYIMWLDFCSRETGWASIYDWKGGTYRYMQNTLASIKKRTSSLDQIIMFNHHPITQNPFCSSFSTHEYLALGDALGDYQNWVGAWFSGHLHKCLEWDIQDYKSWGWGIFRIYGWRTICKNYILDDLKGDSPSFSLVKIMYKRYTGGGGDGRRECPYVYVWDGTQFRKDNSVIPASRIGWTRQDSYKLEVPLQPKNECYVLRIKEDGSMINYFDAVKLIAVDHPDNTIIGTDVSGGIIHHAMMPLLPASCVNKAGENILPLIANDDGVYFELLSGDYLEVDFGDVPDSGWAGIMVGPKDLDGGPTPETIEVWTSDWGKSSTSQPETLGLIFPRGEPSFKFVNLAGYRKDKFKILPLEGMVDSLGNSLPATIGQIAYFTPASSESIEVNDCYLINATYYDNVGGTRDVTDKLSELDLIRTDFKAGEYIEFTFAPPDSPVGLSIKPGYKRDFILVSTGKYVPYIPQYSWRVKLVANSDFGNDTLNYAGVEYVATNEFDAGYDIPEPSTSPSPYLQLYFPHLEWEDSVDKFSQDIRYAADLSDSTMVFEFEVTTDQNNKDITLNTTPLDVPEEYGIYLLDIENNHLQDMRINPEYTYNSGAGGVHKFQLKIGLPTFSGHVTESIIWNWNKKLLITGDVWVDSSVTLTIDPVVTVYFTPQDDRNSGQDNTVPELEVYGTLIADSAQFIISSENGKQYWRVETFGSEARATFTDCSIGHEGDLLFCSNTEPKSPEINKEKLVYTDNTDKTGLPKVFKFSQNKPNPFLKSTSIKYQLPTKSKVSLKIYDVTGRCVKILIDDEKNIGYYKVKWDGEEFSTGIYFAKFVAGDYKSTKKLILMK